MRKTVLFGFSLLFLLALSLNSSAYNPYVNYGFDRPYYYEYNAPAYLYRGTLSYYNYYAPSYNYAPYYYAPTYTYGSYYQYNYAPYYYGYGDSYRYYRGPSATVIASPNYYYAPTYYAPTTYYSPGYYFAPSYYYANSGFFLGNQDFYFGYWNYW